MPRAEDRPFAARRPWQDYVLPVGVVASVLVILVPLPTPLLDVLLAANITLAVIMLLTTIYVRTPLEFSVFPSLLLAATLGRLVLNVATTRLILTQAGRHGLDAAGGVVRSFGEFVTGDQIIVGFVIFGIIVVIQFVVITKGATRLSEVAARFALDGMPGRQMAIDADLQAGIVDEHEARRRRQDIARQADFYGAMDGASKFVRGDAIAGLLITLINILGGLTIGVWQAGMSLSQAGEVFTKLTIGDGLVTQVPAFLVSLAAGLLVTRSTEKTDLPKEFLGQLLASPQALFVAVGFLALLAFTGLPALPLMLIGGGCLGLALALTRHEKQEQQRASEHAAGEKKAAASQEQRVEDYLVVDPMEIEIGTNLIRLADPQRGGELLERIKQVRQQIAAGLGIVMPKVRVRDNHHLDKDSYRIKLADVPVADGSLMPGRLLALSSPDATGKMPGVETKDPAFGTAAVWIEPDHVSQAKMLGYTVVEPVSVLATHLQEVVRDHADEILTRDAAKHLIDELKKTSPAVVDELIPTPMSLAEVQTILQMLLREKVPIRQLGAILETLGESAARVAKDPILLTEMVRQRLARTICGRYRDAQKRLQVVTLHPALEDQIRAGMEHQDGKVRVGMSPQAIQATCKAVAREMEKLKGRAPVLLVNPDIRPALKQLTAPHLPKLVVLSYNEITRDTVVDAVGMVSDVVPPLTTDH